VTDELAWLLSVSGWAIVWGGFSWLAYVSFEPYVRRWWPHTLVSWTRLLAGRIRDPLVGRDVLVGVLAGVLYTALVLIQFEAMGRSAPAIFLQPALEALQSPARFGSIALFTVLNGLQFTLGGIGSLVLLRLLVRRTWIAVAVVIGAALPLLEPSLTPLGIAVAIGNAVIGFVVLLRIGVLANATMLILGQSMTLLPLTLDADAWYFGRSMVALLGIACLAVYGFRVSLGGRSAFGELARAPL
jgi:serine/threonine-protein kinase